CAPIAREKYLSAIAFIRSDTCACSASPVSIWWPETRISIALLLRGSQRPPPEAAVTDYRATMAGAVWPRILHDARARRELRRAAAAHGTDGTERLRCRAASRSCGRL